MSLSCFNHWHYIHAGAFTSEPTTQNINQVGSGVDGSGGSGSFDEDTETAEYYGSSRPVSYSLVDDEDMNIIDKAAKEKIWVVITRIQNISYS